MTDDITLYLTPPEAEALADLLNWEVADGNPIYLHPNSPAYNALWNVYDKLRLQGRGEVVPRPRKWCAPL